MPGLLCLLAFILSILRVKAQCGGMVDLIIAVPGSIGMSSHEFSAYEDNLITLLRHFSIEPDSFNIGLILYGQHAVPIAYPQPFKTRLQMYTRVSLLSQRMAHLHSLGHKNDVAVAIRAIEEMFTTPPPGYSGQLLRPSARKIGVVFTYSPSEPSNIQNVIDAAMSAKSNYMMYALAANGSSKDFPRIGSDYCRLFSMGTLQDSLPYAVPDLASGICSEVDPNAVITANNCFPKRYGVALHYGVTCQVEGNMIQPDPNNCAYYYQCEYFDMNPIRKPCPITTLYDPLTRNCNSLTNVACYNELSCPSKEPMLHPHPLDCTKFLNCFDNLIPYVLSCPDGQVFDARHQTCNETMGVCISY